MNRCCGNCEQGRRRCECPDACQVPDEDDDGLGFFRGLAAAVAITALMSAIGLVIAYA